MTRYLNFPIKLYELDTIKGFMWRHYLNVETGLLESYHENLKSGILIEQVNKTLHKEDIEVFVRDYEKYFVADLDS